MPGLKKENPFEKQTFKFLNINDLMKLGETDHRRSTKTTEHALLQTVTKYET